MWSITIIAPVFTALRHAIKGQMKANFRSAQNANAVAVVIHRYIKGYIVAGPKADSQSFQFRLVLSNNIKLKPSFDAYSVLDA
jgi:hypothetical protein